MSGVRGRGEALDKERPVRNQPLSAVRCAAAIVAFRPAAELLVPLARAAAREAELVMVFANSALSEDVRDALQACGTAIIAPGANVGLGAAFNQCAAAAAEAGMTRLLLLDQDSEIPDGFVGALAEEMDGLAAQGEAPAVVGPRIVSPPGADFKAPRYFAQPGARAIGDVAPVRYVISSGSLIDLAAWARVGPFRADFFIDAIDTEWCFRAWARGASCWVARGVEMRHRIGQGVVRNLGAAVPRQARFRLYAYVRNQSHCLTLAHIPLLWKLRSFAHVVRVVLVYWIDARFSLGFLGSMIEAAWRGLRGKLGPPPGAELV